MSKTAIIYARVSTAGQAEDELPVQSQVEICRKKANELGATVLKEFIDAGISGRTDERPAFRDAIAFCKLNQVDFFVCWNTARFSRNRIDAPWHKIQLKKHGTSMVYVSMNLDTTTKEGWMMEGMLELIDEYYSRQVSDDTVRSMMKNARDGHFNGGMTPYGYSVTVDGKRKRLIIVEHEATLVHEIFDRYIAGAGAKSISHYLNARGSSRRGFKWSKTTIMNMLRNWTYCGYVVFNRRDRHAKRSRPVNEWIKTQSHAAIIEEGQFMKVQSMINSRAPIKGQGSHKSTHLFTGLLKCGRCGRNMKIETATGRSAKYSYYNCSSSIKGMGCKPRRIPADDLDNWLVEHIIGQVMSTENLRSIARDVHQEAGEWVKERERKRAALVVEMRDIEARRRKLYNLLETNNPDALNLGDIKPRLMDLNARARAIEVSLTELEFQEPPELNVSDIDLLELQEFVREVVLTSNNPARIREFLSSFIQEIVILNNEARISYRKDRLVTANTTETVHSKKEWLPEQGLLRTAKLTLVLPDRFKRAA